MAGVREWDRKCVMSIERVDDPYYPKIVKRMHEAVMIYRSSGYFRH